MSSSNVGKWIGLTALASLTALSACGDDKVVVKDVADATSDAIFPDGTNNELPETDTAVPLLRTLEFNLGHGDDQQPCIGRPRCTIFLGYNEEKTLELRYTEDGLPIAGQPIKFALENDPNGLGRLNTLSSATNAEGIGGVKARPKQSVIGQFTVKAWIDNSTIPPKYFDVVVSPKGLVALTVVGSYNGTRPVGTYSVNLYRQNAAGEPNCANISALYFTGDAATVSRDDLLIQQSAKFPDFEGLEAERTQKYTVLAYSKNATDEPQAWGCNATEGVVAWGESKTVEIELLDRPPLYVGAYEVTTRFDFSSAIPQPYRRYVDYVLGFFQTPTGTILHIVCDLLPRDSGGQLNSFCDLVFNETGSGLELTQIGGFVADLLDAVIDGLLENTVFSTIFQVGGDVADILTAFEITSTFTFKKEPNADGVFAAGDTEENWYKVAFKWSLGANCQATEAGCGDRTFNMNAFQTAAVKGTFPASVANFFDLTIGKHSLNLRYGALINYFLEAVLVPIIVNDSTVNSYEDILGYLVGGGAACLSANVTGKDCCGLFADKTGGDKDGIYEGNSTGGDGATGVAIYAACNTILTAAPGFLRQTLTNLDLSTGDGFLIGTDGPCRLQDTNSDLKIDLIGTLTNPCVWDVEINFSDSASTTVDAVFWGRRLDQ